MGRRPCCWKEGLRKGAWSPLEDTILTNFIKTHGTANWRDLPQRAGLERCGKSCRLRWLNYLKPDIKRGAISPDEEDLIFRLHKLLGNRWSLIAGRLPGRTDNEIKNYWNCKLRKIDKNDDHDKKINDDDDNENHNNKVVRTRAVRLTRPIKIITQPRNLQNDHQNQKLMMVGDQDYQKCSSSSRDNIQDYFVNNDGANKQLIDDDGDSIEAAAMMENWMSSWEQNGEDSLIGLMDLNDLELDTFLSSEYDQLFYRA